MRKLMLFATTMLSIPMAYAGQVITPGSGSVTDAAGNVFSVTPGGVVQENGIDVPGGAETARVTISNSVVYGEDSTGRGWFVLGDNGRYWTHSQPPAGGSNAATPNIQSPINGLGTADTTAPTITQVTCQGASATANATGAFHVVGGQIIAPNGQPFIARGINIGPDKIGEAVSNGAATPLLTTFPGINMIRFADGSRSSPDALRSFISTLTAKGIVVEIEDHPWPLVNAYSGGDLQAEASWFAALATAFKDNPFVWFGAQNEPQGGDISSEHAAVYKAVRGAGNNNPIMLDLMGGGVPNALTVGINASAYASMTNVVWDFHCYNWIVNYSTDQATIEAKLKDTTAQVQQITSADGKMPVIIGEYGDSTSGNSPDPGGKETVAAVINGGSAGLYGSLAWNWSAGGGGGDHLVNGDGSASDPYGKAVQMYVGTSRQPCTAAETATNAQSAVSQVTANVVPPSVTIQDAHKAAHAGVPK